MFKPRIVLLAAGLALLCLASLAAAAGTKSAKHHNAVTVVAVLGRAAKVPYGKFVKAYAYCPKGYYVTGGGAYAGAITEIVSSPTPDLRGWFVDGTNMDPKTTFTHRADAVCAKGSPTVPLGTAASNPAAVRRAEAEYVSTHRVLR
jgi:hypothetical protein